ncbi:MAG TPA: tRNA epoxyqueuosine(34) reductase QueG [Burkholderiales bacterium]|nr:tRNA epoxyqueuosine(34) reductase QueG [Burkholderiales bacterium]
MAELADRIKRWGAKLGFQAVGIADADLSAAGGRLAEWLGLGWHGEMDYMARHAGLRARPAELVPGTLRVISCRMDYLQGAVAPLEQELAERSRAYVARYARGRDYHKLMRSRLQRLCERIAAEHGPFRHRAFADSAPVMEVELAARAGIGWRGKHTLLLDRQGSWFFLGEIYCDLPLTPDREKQDHCGTCERCIDICPTRAIVAPYKLDARRCISYLTIEHKSAIPEELRPLVGNRIYGCDDCQLVCPWNGFSKPSPEGDFRARNGLDRATLVALFAWTEGQFDERLRGSPIRRIGYERWLRNLAVGLGNAPTSPEVVTSLKEKQHHPSELVREHVIWALRRHGVAA